MDEKYVLSGSDDTNIRLWKSVSNEAVKIVYLNFWIFNIFLKIYNNLF